MPPTKVQHALFDFEGAVANGLSQSESMEYLKLECQHPECVVALVHVVHAVGVLLALAVCSPSLDSPVPRLLLLELVVLVLQQL